MPIGSGPVGMRTRMPPARCRCWPRTPGRLPIGAGPVGMRTRMPPVCTASASAGLPGPPAARRRCRHCADCRSAPSRSGCGRGCRRCGIVAGFDTGSAADQRRSGRDADADAGGAVSLRTPVPGRWPLGAGPVGMRTRMPPVTDRAPRSTPTAPANRSSVWRSGGVPTTQKGVEIMPDEPNNFQGLLERETRRCIASTAGQS